jgi:hypothetical protein
MEENNTGAATLPRLLVPIKRGRWGTRPNIQVLNAPWGYSCDYVRITGTIGDPRLITRDKENPNACILTITKEAV